VPADAITALEAVDGKTFVPQHLQRAEAGRTGADQTVVATTHPVQYRWRVPVEQAPVDYAIRRIYLRMTLQQLTYFLAAAEQGSFTAAADALRLARPSVSEQIANLEAELGVPLFVRTGRRLELTEAGRLLRPEAERTLAAARVAVETVRDARALTGGTASLGAFSTAHHLLLPGLIEDFASRHPNVAVRVLEDNSSQLADAVRLGRIEAALVALPIDGEGLDVGPALARLEVVYASAGPPIPPVTIERLAEAVLVLPEARFGDADPTRRQLAERAARAGLPFRPHIEVQHAEAALELAARGLGATIVTRALVDRLGYADRLGVAPLDPPLHEVFAFIRRRTTRLSPATEVLMTLAQDQLERRS
jgi:DNA-binding transcriptional LysR family regulator